MSIVEMKKSERIFGSCQDPACERCKSMTVPALPPPGYALSAGSLNHDLNHGVPVLPDAWTEMAQRIVRAIQVETGCTRLAAIRAYRRGDVVCCRRLCGDTSGGDYHFLPADARGNVLFCDRECRRQAA